MTPNGLISNLFGQVEGKRHDSGMLVQSQVLRQLQDCSLDTYDNVLCIYDEPAYPVTQQVQGPFRGVMLSEIQRVKKVHEPSQNLSRVDFR